jgi:hypothetical protein
MSAVKVFVPIPGSLSAELMFVEEVGSKAKTAVRDARVTGHIIYV